jgi:hypothetical protein
MRSIVVSAFALSLFSVSAMAADQNKITCKAYAQAMADDFSANELVRADAGDPLGDADKILIIAAGKSYYVPRQQNGVILKSVGTTIREHKQIYAQEFHRCMKGGNITINVDGSLPSG